MEDICLTGGAIALFTTILGAYNLALVSLFRALVAAREDQVRLAREQLVAAEEEKRDLRALALRGTDLTDRTLTVAEQRTRRPA